MLLLQMLYIACAVGRVFLRGVGNSGELRSMELRHVASWCAWLRACVRVRVLI